MKNEKEINNWEERFEESWFGMLEDSEKTIDAHIAMVHLHDLTEKSENPRVLEKIERCLNVANDSQKELILKEAILLRLSYYFYPLFEQEKYQEEVTSEGIDSVANLLGEMVENHNNKDDDFVRMCKDTFVKTINLKEINQNEKL